MKVSGIYASKMNLTASISRCQHRVGESGIISSLNKSNVRDQLSAVTDFRNREAEGGSDS